MELKTKNDIDLLMNSTTPSAALKAAIETGLLWRLEAKPLRAQEVARAFHIPGKRSYYWLQFLCTLGILENDPDGYKPSSLAREAILDTRTRESWQHLAQDERERSAGLNNLPLYINAPGSIWSIQDLNEPEDYVKKMKTSPSRAREFTRMLYRVHQPMANRIAELLDLKGIKRMMDLGGGSGVISMALLRKYPTLTSLVVDIKNVCIAGREIAVKEGLSDRLGYHPADITSDQLPTGFDQVLQCDVGVFGLALFQKLNKSLNPGGGLVFVERFSPEENSAPEEIVRWVFRDSLCDPNISFPTIRQIRADLFRAGFEVLPAHQTLDSGWTILQARRRESA
jgi:ubiquinone/menaquinone biosynthesis C-methylase UbiE